MALLNRDFPAQITLIVPHIDVFINQSENPAFIQIISVIIFFFRVLLNYKRASLFTNGRNEEIILSFV